MTGEFPKFNLTKVCGPLNLSDCLETYPFLGIFDSDNEGPWYKKHELRSVLHSTLIIIIIIYKKFVYNKRPRLLD